MESIIIITIASFFLLLGIIGSLVPIIPGPIMSFLGLLIIHFFSVFTFSNQFLVACGIATLLVFLSDYFLQIFGVKKFGGGKNSIFGTMIGVIIGLFFVPLGGLFFGPFIGAYFGALMDNKQKNQAFKIAIGSLVGFLFGTFVKFAFSIYVIYAIFNKIFY